MGIEINAGDMKRLEARYGAELTQRALRVVDTYTQKIQREAKGIIDDEGYRDTGRLINSIKPSVRMYADKIAGEIYAGTKYARFVHEGAKHENDTTIAPHFVPFGVSKELFIWAERHGIIYRKTKTGKKARQSSIKASIAYSGAAKTQWYFKSKRTGKEYPINVRTGGLMVKTRPTKFFEKPFLESKDDFIREMGELVGGDI